MVLETCFNVSRTLSALYEFLSSDRICIHGERQFLEVCVVIIIVASGMIQVNYGQDAFQDSEAWDSHYKRHRTIHVHLASYSYIDLIRRSRCLLLVFSRLILALHQFTLQPAIFRYHILNSNSTSEYFLTSEQVKRDCSFSPKHKTYPPVVSQYKYYQTTPTLLTPTE